MKTLIILHGWQSSKEKWQRVKEALETEGLEVIVPDLPGFKPETELQKPWDLNDYVNWLEKFFSQNIRSFSRPWKTSDKVFLLGHSFGGRIAIKFANQYPEKLKGLILVSAAGIKPKKNFWQPMISTIAPIASRFSFLPGYQFLRKVFYKFVLRKTDYLKAKGAMKQTFKNIIEEDLTSYLAKIKTPTLILWGEKDKITPLSDAYLMKEKIKNSKLEILEGVGHTPHLENPKLLSQKIINFINQTP